MNGNNEREKRQQIFVLIEKKLQGMVSEEERSAPIEYWQKKRSFGQEVKQEKGFLKYSDATWYVKIKRKLNILADHRIGIDSKYTKLNGTTIYLRDARSQSKDKLKENGFEEWAIMALSDFQIAEQIIRNTDKKILDSDAKNVLYRKIRLQAAAFLEFITESTCTASTDAHVINGLEAHHAVSHEETEEDKSIRESVHSLLRASQTQTFPSDIVDNEEDFISSPQQIAYKTINTVISQTLADGMKISRDDAIHFIEQLKDFGSMDTPPCPLVTLSQPKEHNSKSKVFAQVDVPICHLTDAQKMDYIKILVRYGKPVPKGLEKLEQQVNIKEKNGKQYIKTPSWFKAINDEYTKAMVLHYLPKLLDGENPSGLPTQMINVLPGLRNAGEERIYVMDKENPKPQEQNRAYHSGSMGQDTHASFEENVRLTKENIRAFQESQGNPKKVRVTSFISPHLAMLPYWTIPLSFLGLIALPALFVGDLLTFGRFSQALLPSAILPKKAPQGFFARMATHALGTIVCVAAVALSPIIAVLTPWVAPRIAKKLPQNERDLYLIQKEAIKQLNAEEEAKPATEEKAKFIYANTPLDITRIFFWWNERDVEDDVWEDAKTKIALLMVSEMDAATDRLLNADTVLSPKQNKAIEKAINKAANDYPDGVPSDNAREYLKNTLKAQSVTENHVILFQHMVELQRLKRWWPVRFASFTLGEQNNTQRSVKESQMQSLISTIEIESDGKAQSTSVKACKSGKDRKGMQELFEETDVVGRNLDSQGRSCQLHKILDKGFEHLRAATMCVVGAFHTMIRAGLQLGSEGSRGFKNDGNMLPLMLIPWQSIIVTATASANKKVKRDKKVQPEEEVRIDAGVKKVASVDTFDALLKKSDDIVMNNADNDNNGPSHSVNYCS